MSKLWLLLLLVAAFQAVRSFPAEVDYPEERSWLEDFTSMEEDKVDSTATIIKDTWGKLKKLWKSKKDELKGKGKDKLDQIIAKLKDMLCKQKDFLDLDYEEDAASDSVQAKLMQKIKELQNKIKQVTEEKKLALLQRIEELRAKICDKLSDAEDTEDGDDEERIKWGKIGKNIMKGAKKAWKKMKPALKNAVKKGGNLLRRNSVKVTPLECDDKTCKTCINLVFLGLSACLKATISREDKVTYFTIAGDVNGSPQFQEKIKLGDVPRCLNAGSVIGKICVKGVEGKGKSSQGKASPQLFAGGLDDSGDIIVGNEKDESQGVSLDADEFEID
uniref:Secreted Redulysin-like protein n=1 Tax=Pristhesancus plagipennis TaxID=1955184 RepID=A0A2K8JLT7_PRIPG|nr:secreted Redulysin-like protein [Pristhesancus plagipennis]